MRASQTSASERSSGLSRNLKCSRWCADFRAAKSLSFCCVRAFDDWSSRCCRTCGKCRYTRRSSFAKRVTLASRCWARARSRKVCAFVLKRAASVDLRRTVCRCRTATLSSHCERASCSMSRCSVMDWSSSFSSGLTFEGLASESKTLLPARCRKFFFVRMSVDTAALFIFRTPEAISPPVADTLPSRLSSRLARRVAATFVASTVRSK
mmetsp:Transcript_101163/g.286777  ORF Transcript_101163/g.286777 Transcript_101163/m.286777 type:complete len:209 (-) Transcript_101163:557-1183(-)